MRITKDEAREIALKLTSKKKRVFTDLETSFLQKIEDELMLKIPADIKKVFKSNPGYITKESYVKISGNGWNFQSFSLRNSIPSPNRNTHQFTPELKLATELMKEYNHFEELKTEYKKLFEEVERTLYNLRTYNKIKEVFPEAAEFLPKSKETQITINLTDLRNRLK